MENTNTSRVAGLPAAEDAEKGLVASMLMMPACIDEFAELPGEAFYSEQLAVIVEALREMRGARVPIDIISVSEWLDARHLLEQVGGGAVMADLLTFVPTAANRSYYADVVREMWQRRRVILAAAQMSGLARDRAKPIEELMAEVDALARQLVKEQPTGQGTIRHCGKIAMDALDHMEKVHAARGRTVGIATGIHDWDRMTGGLMGGELIVIAGRPSHGKSALGMQVAIEAAKVGRIPTMVFSVEMPSLQLMVRALCSQTQVNLQRVRDGYFSKNQVSLLIAKVQEFQEAPLYLDDSAGLTSAQLRARAMEAYHRYGCRLIVVDYLQFMKGSTKRAKESKQLEVAEISGTMKEIAKELNVPVIALAQLNRDAEEYAQPKLSHLRDSGSIEQDADQVLLIHRLDKSKTNKKRDEDEQERDHNTLLLLEKQRNGPTGPIKLMFDADYTLFRNVTAKIYSNSEEERQK